MSYKRGFKKTSKKHDLTSHIPIKYESAPADLNNLDLSLDGYVVQNLLLPPIDKSAIDLYIRIINGNVEFIDETIYMKRGSHISFNTYFNSFYEAYWEKYTTIEDAELVIIFKGEGRVDVFRETYSSGCQRIHWKSISSRNISHTGINLYLFPVIGQSGRIFFDFLATSHVEIHYIGIRSKKHPERDAKLTFGICTFNQEKYLLNTLNKLIDYNDGTKNIQKIIVVNQGSDFTNNNLKKLIEQNRLIKCIKQDNSGGCGGFTRSIYESKSFCDANYHVLMDDDIQIDPRIIANLSALISYLRKEIIIGGHMLDLLKPLVLYEAGAIVKKNTRIMPQHHNVDLRGIDSLHRFTTIDKLDYNAWWFCAIPKEHIDKAEYPAPIFIRGDDMEYGVRMKSIGVETIAMPGIAVWHEPFYAKAGSWQKYYDFRNRLIMASVYPARFILESPNHLLWIMTKALSVHDYQEAALVHLAVEDFLKGPNLFKEETSKQIHERIVNISKLYQPESINENKGYKNPELKKIPSNRINRQFLVIRRLFSAYLVDDNKKTAEFEFLDKDIHPAHIGAHAYIKTNGLKSYKLLYYPDRKKLSSLLKCCLSSYLRYRSQSLETAKKWYNDIHHFRKEEWWSNMFSKNEEKNS